MIDEIQVHLKEERDELLLELIDKLEEYYENLTSKPTEWIELLGTIENTSYGDGIIEDIKDELINDNEIFEIVNSIIEACDDKVFEISNTKQIDSIYNFQSLIDIIKEAIENIGTSYLIDLKSTIDVFNDKFKKVRKTNSITINGDAGYLICEYVKGKREGNLPNGNLKLELNENLIIELDKTSIVKKNKRIYIRGKYENGEIFIMDITEFCFEF